MAAGPPGVKPDHINLKVTGTDGHEVYFKVKHTTPFKKLMDAYCQRQGKSLNTVRFLFDGTRLGPDQTRGDFDMEDEDTFDVMIEQVRNTITFD